MRPDKGSTLEMLRPTTINVNPRIAGLRRPRFSLRALLTLFTLLAIWLAWYVHRSQQQQHGVAAIRELGGTVHYSFQMDHNGIFDANTSPRIPRRLWGWLGEDFLWPVLGVDLRGDDIKNEDLSSLRYLPRTKRLTLYCPHVGDGGLQHVAQLGNLKALHLSESGISPSGIERLGRLKKLEYLQLAGTQVDDSSIPDIARLPSLVHVALERTAVTESGVSKLRELRPRMGYYISVADDAEANAAPGGPPARGN